MITDSIINLLISGLSQLYLWSVSTIAVSAYGVELSFFEIWTSNMVALAITETFMHVFHVWDMPDDSD